MNRSSLRETLNALPKTPGVYLFKAAGGEVVYVGKAKVLRDRVRSYFRPGGDGRPAVRFIEERVEEIETITTRSEKEAFLLENNLIKKFKPRFNIRLKDDKTYLHLKLDRKHPFPAIVPVRRPRKDGATYFGPYSSARAIRTTLRVLRGIYPLRDCTDREFETRTRPCLKYQIRTCCAPCVDYVTKDEYRGVVDGAVRVLQGHTDELQARLEEEMRASAERLEFERAAVLRDRVSFLRNSTETQAVEMGRTLDRDVVGSFRRGRSVEIVVLLFRDGKLLSAQPFSFQTDLPDDEALAMFLGQYYHSGRPVPHEVLLPTAAYGMETFAELLRERAGRAVRVSVPKSGEGHRALEMACRNAELAATTAREQASVHERVLAEVVEQLGLRTPPRVIECIDISHLQGAHPVASLVRFEDGEPDRDGYRRFRIQEATPGDDPGAIAEVVRRRFSPKSQEEHDPDLLMVDGGALQLRAAVGALDGVVRKPRSEFAGIAKPARRGRGLKLRAGEEERIFRPDRGAPIRLRPETEGCYLLQRVRDEAHRFAVAYHRRLRSKEQRTSSLEEIDGLGRARARALLTHFGGLAELKAASSEALRRAPGIGPTLAERIDRALHPEGRGAISAGQDGVDLAPSDDPIS